MFVIWERFFDFNLLYKYMLYEIDIAKKILLQFWDDLGGLSFEMLWDNVIYVMKM